ncbi:DUF4373 domain-containing protein [Paenibacillus sp. IITD108]|uniref:DUF4373 domain-containing protein n=1 Tax=Paenibacillus sp. IITD108 TaxID=3116649 RepID=UPI002F42B821
MARPAKEGLDYFPLDVSIDQDDKLVVVISKFGMEGFGVIIRLMSEIYKNSYYYAWGEREQYVFSNRVNVDINTVKSIVNECIKWGFFDQGCFDNHHILTSRGFQHRYIGASKRRKSITFIDDYTLIDLQQACEKVSYPIISVDACGNQVNVYINEVKADITNTESTQREKEIEKEKEREKDIKDISAEIKNFRISYSTELLEIIDSYFEFIAGMRKSKKIGDGIYLKVYRQFMRYSSVRIEFAIKTHMGSIEHSKAQEEYTFGILRNTTDDEAAAKLRKMATKPNRPSANANDRLADRNRKEAEKIREAMERERIGTENVIIANF